ncbi:protein of unknown function [Taphrina deformans PYCC 5710]|uniref:Autophagy-related protein 18 n=1 Tax=Taphrina deformans (strain PYCC 5710 / ATCC 11124 / CBS 356.35 / IMI 108563 / JCM 9778 / NBRC 8474) TaxID=1097556 RepID=R4XDE6_TAPDE|nr:protein of unknown function [Taphrina deformans PYCC 5710]|eukprot:CCG83855.1 protein of unknown function [Taphrina deformans PYCC 5710]
MDATTENLNLFAMSFNQDFTCFAIGTKEEGYKLYNVDAFGKIHSHPSGGYGVVEMLFCTSLVALVGLGDQPDLSPRRLQIVNTKRQSTICELTFPTSILAVRLNRKRLIAVLEQQIYIYDISNMKLLHTIETSSNPGAICALSPDSENCFITYPSPTPSSMGSNSAAHAPGNTPQMAVSGDALLFDALNLKSINVIEAHKAPLAAMALNNNGTLLATASDKGTIIRVFQLPGGEKLFQFRRGSLPTKIQHMSFDMTSSFLAVSSASETVHIFRLSNEQLQDPEADVGVRHDNARNNKRGAMGMIRKQSQNLGRTFAGTFGSYLPNRVTEIWEPMRDFASFKIPAGSVKSVVAISSSQARVIVITSTGYFLQYEIDLERGGDCTLVEQNVLLESLQ